MSEKIRLYKFYSGERAIQNVESKKLKISTLDDLNDPFEFRSFRLPDGPLRNAWEARRTKLFTKKGIICFCEHWNNPVIWSHYADNHRGLALGFDVSRELTMKVQYRKMRKKIPSMTEMPIPSLMRLVKGSLATKFIHWEYENERRIFADADEVCPQSGLYFKGFDDDLILREVIIGAQSKLSSAAIRDKAKLGDDVVITTARLAFNSFKIVRQRDISKMK